MMSMMWARAILLSTLFLSAVGFTTMINPVSSMRGQISMVAMKKKETPAKPAREPQPEPGPGSAAVPLFPYGIASFKMIIEENRFWSDKTMYIKELERVSNHIKIWRPRRFGKSLLCDMLEQYYDKANSKTQRDALFGQTEMMTTTPPATTYHMGKYLVLRLSFSSVPAHRDVEKDFNTYIDNAVRKFSKKYYKAGLLNMPIEINTEDALSSLRRLFDEVERAGEQIHLIVDECDSFPVEFSSSLSMVTDLTFEPAFAGMFGLTKDDVVRGLHRIGHLTEQQRIDFLEQMREQYDGYRFVRTQKKAVYNPQYVHYFLNHLDRLGVPPESLIDSA
ncbi:hypothetical protein B484DRAFT_439965, partial [Ochromonadaceae sp. CCMP2298]